MKHTLPPPPLKSHLILMALALLSSGLSVPAHANPYKDLPGSIPLRLERPAASDLIYQGKRIMPDQAKAKVASGEIKDLSDLQPMGDSRIWKNQMLSNLDKTQDDMGLTSQGEVLEFESTSEVPVGRAGFVASKTLADGTQKSYQILLDLKGHNVLLRRDLLRRIGYQIPKTGYLQSVRIKFKGAFSKNEFVRATDSQTFLQANRWITAGFGYQCDEKALAEKKPEAVKACEESQLDQITVQDAVVFEGQNDPYYNLARGDMTGSVIQGRRLFNALLVAYNLTDVAESVNLFPWLPGRIFNDQLILPYEDASEFTTSYEDARWIAKRIAQLTRADFESIVASAQLPTEVSLLVTEKLISRRNHLIQLLKVQAAALPVNSGVSQGQRLSQGKLLGAEPWSGYAPRFAGVDPESPFAGPEVTAFAKSKVLSAGLANLVSHFNTEVLPRTDIAAKIMDRQMNQAVDQFAEFISTGQVKKIPVGAWVTPKYGTHLILSREIIAGNYMGAENTIQIADLVGFNANAGVYIGVDGLPSKLRVDATSQLSYTRTYVHLKPVKSIKASLKEPFKNLLVMNLKRNLATPLDELIKLDAQKSKLEPEAFQKKAEEILTQFKDQLGVGETLIVQTALGPEFQAQLGYGIHENLQAYMSLMSRTTVMNRLNIFRRDENTIQIFRDPARFHVLDASFGLSAKVEFLRMGWTWTKGKATTEFYELNLNKDLEQNPDLFKNAAILRAVLRTNKIPENKISPWVFKHAFSEKDTHVDFLVWRYFSTNLWDRIQIQGPQGGLKNFINRVVGKRTGTDIVELAAKGVQAIIAELSGQGSGWTVPNLNAENPGDTIKGHSAVRQVNLQASTSTAGTKETLDSEDLYVGVSYRWKGWSLKRADLLRRIDQINKKFGTILLSPAQVPNTQYMQFYNLDLIISIYQQGLESLVNLSSQQLEQIYRAHCLVGPNQKTFLDAYLAQYRFNQAQFQNARKSGKVQDQVNALTNLVNLVESTLSFDGLQQIVGGKNNLFARAALRGFRGGEENAGDDIFSDTLGEVGSLKMNGPLSQVGQRLKIPDGELFLYWLLNRL